MVIDSSASRWHPPPEHEDAGTSRRTRRALARPLSYAALLCLTIAVLSALGVANAFAKTVLVVAPHPDDEALMAAGVIRRAIDEGDTVLVAIMTNGDFNGTAMGLTRQGESVAAMSVLGLDEDHVAFLGYGDGLLMTLYTASSETTVFTSAAGQTKTYGNRGLGRRDYHSHAFGVPGVYSRKTVLQDLTDLLVELSPDDVYTTSYYDSHADHLARRPPRSTQHHRQRPRRQARLQQW